MIATGYKNGFWCFQNKPPTVDIELQKSYFKNSLCNGNFSSLETKVKAQQ